MNIDQIVNQAEPELIAFRRHFHKYPELSQQEFNTLDFIKQKLESWGISCTQVPKGGIFGVLDSGKPGITVLLRADVDACPVDKNKKTSQPPGAAYPRIKGSCMPAVMMDTWPCFLRRPIYWPAIRKNGMGRLSLCLNRQKKWGNAESYH